MIDFIIISSSNEAHFLPAEKTDYGNNALEIIFPCEVSFHRKFILK